MKLTRTVQTDAPRDRVAAYLSDFTTTTEWDPGTVRTERTSGDGGVGSTYLNVSKFLGRETELTYRVTALEPGRHIALEGKNKSVTANDSMTFEDIGAGTVVTYEVNFEFHGVSGLVAPLLKPALTRLANHAEEGMSRALAKLSARA